MADLTITAANVVKYSGAFSRSGTAGEDITAGEAVYLSGGEVMLAQADDEDTDAAVGIALNSAADGQPVSYLVAGGLNPGATVTVGTVYVVSAAAAGGIAPLADLASTEYVTILGVGTTTSRIDVNINVSGVAIPA
jgi:predicted transcriptional regulator